MEKGKQHSDNNNEKKITRKEIERQRRQHMAMLHSSLRSLLPQESIKGKRSISDHMNEAENYIKYLKTKIQELSLKRDQLKTLTDLEVLGHKGSNSDDRSIKNCVSIHPYSGGVEILISGVHREENLLLSKVLEAVLEEGLDVIRCVSTKTQGVFHTIQAEVGDLTCVDLCGLQQKLDHMIN